MSGEQLLGHEEIGLGQAVGDEVRGFLSPGEHRGDVGLVERADEAPAPNYSPRSTSSTRSTFAVSCPE